MHVPIQIFIPSLKKEVEFQPFSGQAGIEIFRSTDHQYFLKRYSNNSWAQKEQQILMMEVSFKKPTVLDTIVWEERECLVLQNARVQPRLLNMTLHQVLQAVEVLSQVHELYLGQEQNIQFGLNCFHARQKEVSTELHGELSSFRPIGDALCHTDLHLSNWLVENDEVVGLLDWIAYGYGDPEEDLAGLILESGHWNHRQQIIESWEGKTERLVDPKRFLLYFWLLTEEKQGKKELTIAQQETLEQCITEYRALPLPTRKPRVLVKPRHSSSAWVAYPESLEDVYRRIQHPQVLGECQLGEVQVFTEHACNDVLRLKCNDRSLILKIYNKPNECYLSDLELHMAKHLESPACAVAPILLKNGGHLFRISGHLASLYPDLGDHRLDNSNRSLRITVRAQAAIHRCPIPNSFSLPILPGIDQWSFMQDRIKNLTSKEQQNKIERIMEENVLPEAERFPMVICHGSVHRDHTIVHQGDLAIIDWEKSSLGPRVRAVARSVVFLGYRDNDEQLSPEKMIRYCVYYHQENRLDDREIQVVSHFIIAELIHDLKALSQNITDYNDGQQRIDHHINTIVDFDHNKASFQTALEKYLLLYKN
jgi:Ser/Thr protein kinase RdoA (MazF antagonist)